MSPFAGVFARGISNMQFALKRKPGNKGFKFIGASVDIFKIGSCLVVLLPLQIGTSQIIKGNIGMKCQ